MRRRLATSLPWILLLVTMPFVPGARASGEHDLARCTPEEQGVDSRVLLSALRVIEDEDLDLHSILFVRNGCIIAECYVHPYDEDALHNVKSVSKSIMSAMVGIALEEGIIESLDKTVYEYFPQYITDDMDPRKKRITLRDLLTMRSGLELDENGPIMARIFRSDDWIKATFERPMEDDPGVRFTYSTPLTHTMSGILTDASGKSLLELCTRYLFEPLGIADVRWKRGPKGYYFGGAELFMRPRDMAKFGVMFLDKGRWRGTQVVPEAWVDASTKDQVGTPPGSGMGYGYWWWMQGEGMYAARGWGGQVISVEPSTKSVVVATSADPAAPARIFRAFGDYEPSDEPLPPNPEAFDALQRFLEKLEHPEPERAPRVTALAQAVSGRQYVFDDNPRGLEDVRFEFGRKRVCRIVITLLTGTYDLAIGLDGIYRVTDTGFLGHMPGGNRVALRGTWAAHDTFDIEYHEMGNPTHATLSVTFEEDKLKMSYSVRPIGARLELTGKRLQ